MTLVSEVFKVELLPLIHRWKFTSYTGDIGLCPESTYAFTINDKYHVYYKREFTDSSLLKNAVFIFNPGEQIVITQDNKIKSWVIDIDWKTHTGNFYFEDTELKNVYGYPEYKKHDNFSKVIQIKKVVCNEIHRPQIYRPFESSRFTLN